MSTPGSTSNNNPSKMVERMHAMVQHLDSNKDQLPEDISTSHSVNLMRAAATVRDPFLNEDTGFTTETRQTLGLRGLLPPAIETLDEQMYRVLDQMRVKRTTIGKYSYLADLRRNNTTLFYHILLHNTSEIVPLIYTPVVGEACIKWSSIYQRPEGMYVSHLDKGSIREVLKNWPLGQESRICVVTDGSRILGLGDLGVGGMGISIGKLSLYVTAAGIRPWSTIPICIDLGTDNQKNLQDPFYLGLRMPRVSPAEAVEFMDEFMEAVHAQFPKLVIQHEDFATERAFQYLERYQWKYPMFNDDIQGTGSVILGGFINAALLSSEASGLELNDHRIVFMGAGSAGVGVAKQLLAFFKNLGMSEEDAKDRVWLVDTKGLVSLDRGDKLASHKTYFARKAGGKQIKALVDIINEVKPTALIGLAATPNLFDKDVVQAMAKHNARPIIFPLSNPVSLAECTYEEAIEWTNGKVLFASGSPFPKIEKDGKTYEPGQGNNMYVFPGIGLASIVAEVKHISDSMIETSAIALSEALDDDEKADELLYPRLTRIRQISEHIAVRVIRQAQKEGLDKNARLRDMTDFELSRYVHSKVYWPRYTHDLASGYKTPGIRPLDLTAVHVV